MKKLISLFSLLVVLSLLLCSCGSSGKGLTAEPADNIAAEGTDAPDANSGDTSSLAKTPAAANRKIIEYITLDLETKHFDDLSKKISDAVTSCGGYIQTSDMSNPSVGSRNAEYVVRIPCDKKAEFTGIISEEGNIVRSSVNTEDVTLNYVDTESRIKALTAEKAAYEKLLANSSSVEDIIAVQDKLSNVIYELESYQSQLRTYDSLIDYTTITLNVSESTHAVAAQNQGVWQQIGTNLSDNFSDVWSLLVGIFVLLISAIPYLLLIGVIVLVIILIVRASKRRKAKKLAERTVVIVKKPESGEAPENK